MERTLYGFRYDYIRHRGTCLVLWGEEPLSRSALARIELLMLENNEIAGLLPFEAEEIDKTVRLRYNITGKTMLSKWMKTGKMNLASYYKLLLRCAQAIDDGKSYMLREEGYWLHEDFMFVDDGGEGGPDLVYVPAASVGGKPGVREQFKELALRLSACIEFIEGPGFSSLMAALHRERLEFGEIRKLLGDLLRTDNAERSTSERSRVGAAGVEQLPKAEPNEAWAREAASEPSDDDTRVRLPDWIRPGPFPDFGVSPDEKPSRAPVTDDEEDGKRPIPESDDTTQTAKQKWLGFAAAAAVLLLLWSFYPENAPEGAVNIWGGLTLLVLDAVFVWIRLRPAFAPSKGLQTLARSYREMEEREMTGLTGYLPVKSKKSVTMTASIPAVREPNHPVSQAAISLPYKPPSDTASDRTTLLRPPDATVLLRPGDRQGEHGAGGDPEQKRQCPYLEISKDGETKRFDMPCERFLIGRQSGAVDYADDTAGVSKLHVEIGREQTEYAAKDLGSKNGTLWNNEPMVPYKSYKLSDGDRLQIVGTRIVFRLGTDSE
ncbi:DUF6382 domain-containing protein [Paenibacillus ginsengarvi]|nr:DUF6382 domain-containing protein [Paenibacillus ginsengarvi]